MVLRKTFGMEAHITPLTFKVGPAPQAWGFASPGLQGGHNQVRALVTPHTVPSQAPQY